MSERGETKTVIPTTSNNTNNAGVITSPTVEIMVLGRIMNPMAIILKITEKIRRVVALSSTSPNGNHAIS